MPPIHGQDHALDVIRRALAAGRLHHAWIFSGPRGVGKFTTARRLATLLLNPSTDVTNPQAFEQYMQGHAEDLSAPPDLHIIQKELAAYSTVREVRDRKQINIPLDLLRELVLGGRTADDKFHDAKAYQKPVNGHGKVFIIDEAELMDANAQNAFLKTLEEPPDRTYLFLITARPQRLLPTILSRCQHVRFGTLDESAMRAWFEHAPLDLSASDREWIEWFADGSPGMATLAVDYQLTEWRHTVDAMIRTIESGSFPLGAGDTLAGLVDEFAKRWVDAHSNANKDAANKDGARHLFAVFSRHARSELSHTVDDPAGVAHWTRIINAIRDAEAELGANVNMKMVLENLMARWAGAGRPAMSTC